MSRSTVLIWITVIIFLLLPTPAGRLLLDMAGGLLIFLLFLPILITGSGWILWKVLKSKMKSCPQCGAQYFGEVSKCTMCGASIYNSVNSQANVNIPASAATIDIKPNQTEN